MRTVAELPAAKPNEVRSIVPNETVRMALERMAKLDIGALVVREGPRVATPNTPACSASGTSRAG